MSVAGNTRNLRHGHLSMEDGALAAGIADANNTLAVPIDDGNLSFDESTPAVVVKNRGTLDHFSKAEEMPVTLSFTAKFSEWGSKGTQAVVADSGDIGSLPDGGPVVGFSVRDFLQNGGGLLTSTNGRNDNFTLTLVFLIDNPMSSGDAAETLTFTKFKCTGIKFGEGADANTMSISGTALLTTPASTRS